MVINYSCYLFSTYDQTAWSVLDIAPHVIWNSNQHASHLLVFLYFAQRHPFFCLACYVNNFHSSHLLLMVAFQLPLSILTEPYISSSWSLSLCSSYLNEHPFFFTWEHLQTLTWYIFIFFCFCPTLETSHWPCPQCPSHHCSLIVIDSHLSLYTLTCHVFFLYLPHFFFLITQMTLISYLGTPAGVYVALYISFHLLLSLFISNIFSPSPTLTSPMGSSQHCCDICQQAFQDL